MGTVTVTVTVTVSTTIQCDWELASKYLFPGAAKGEKVTHSSHLFSKRNSGPGAVFKENQ